MNTQNKYKFSSKLNSLFIILFTLLLSYSCFSQNAAINTTGTPADASAAFEVTSTTGGLLIPRMTTTERNAISNPAQGLQIYNLTTKCFEYFEYGVWQQWHCAVCPLPDAAGLITGSSDVCNNDNNIQYSVPVINYATNYIWSYTGTGVIINGSSDSITLDFSSSATSGDLTVKATNQCGDGTVSANFAIVVNSIPSAPIAGTHTPTQTEIVWNWNIVQGASGYKYNTVNDYFTATDNGNSTSFTQTGLICNTLNTLYVWAYNNCGNSSYNVIQSSTLPCVSNACGIVTFNYNGSQVTYGTVTGQNGTCWLDRNLGANRVATSFDDSDSYGDLFQWGRGDDGHQSRTSSMVSGSTTSYTPGSDFIINSGSNWYNGSNPDNLWQGVSGINNPCPSGWRVPVSSELDNERISWTSQDYYGAYSNALKWTAAGYRAPGDGVLTLLASSGRYRSSTVSTTSAAYTLRFSDISTDVYSNARSTGNSVRCILDY